MDTLLQLHSYRPIYVPCPEVTYIHRLEGSMQSDCMETRISLSVMRKKSSFDAGSMRGNLVRKDVTTTYQTSEPGLLVALVFPSVRIAKRPD